MANKYGSFSSLFLTAIGEATGFFEWPIEYSEGWRRKQLARGGKKVSYNELWRLKNRGLVKVLKRGDKKFLALTHHGELEVLLLKARSLKPANWDGKWRVVIFDIPEGARDKRDQLRWLLKKNGFVKLQASVFISPYPLNRDAIDYLQQTGLISFIRIARIDEIDTDSDLKKKFKL